MQLNAVNANHAYSAARPATQADPAAASASQFVGSKLSDFADTLRQSEQVSIQAMTGGADPHALVEALAQSELAVETLVSVRDKVVEAYQEILRMPV